MNNQKVTPDYVRALTGPTEKFLCKLQDNNKYKLQFLTFRIRDISNKKVLFEIKRTADPDEQLIFDDSLFEEEDLNELRTIRYNFGPEFLDLDIVGTCLEFKVADDQHVRDFMIIERHYFREHLIENYEFSFPMCLKGTTNTWEKIYNFPHIDPDLKLLMIANPWETQSDTFYFVGEDLVMHNKAYYSYSGNNDIQKE